MGLLHLDTILQISKTFNPIEYHKNAKKCQVDN